MNPCILCTLYTVIIIISIQGRGTTTYCVLCARLPYDRMFSTLEGFVCVCVCRPRVLGNNTIYAGGDREADKDRRRIFFLLLFLSGTRFHRVPWPTRSESPLTRPLFMSSSSSSSSLGLFLPPLPALSNQPPARLPRFLLVVPVPFTRRVSSTVARTRRPPREQCPVGRGAYSEESAAVPRSWFRGRVRSFRTQYILSRSRLLYIIRTASTRHRYAYASPARS